MSDRPSRIFGVTTTLSGTIGTGIIANSVSYNNSVDVAEARSETGQVLDLAGYARNGELQIEGLFVGDGVEAGSKFTIGDRDYLVSNSTKNENNTDFQRCSVTARYADPDTTIWALSSIQGA